MQQHCFGFRGDCFSLWQVKLATALRVGGTFFTLKVYEGVGISQLEVFETGHLTGCGEKWKIMQKFWVLLCRRNYAERRQIMRKFLKLKRLFPWLFQTYKIHVTENLTPS